MKLFDGLNREIDFEAIPERIVSTIPCVTETLFELGAEKRIAGITDYCISPEDKVRDVRKIGGPKSIDKSIIDEIYPDLIFMDPEENTLDDFKVLREKYSIFIVKVKTILDSVSFIRNAGEILKSGETAGRIIAEIGDIIHEFEDKHRNTPARSVLVLIWKYPYIVPGGDTYINSVLETCGMSNVFASKSGYSEVDEAELMDSSPDIILLPDEPYEFDVDEVIELRELFEERGPPLKVKNISGADLCWYGFRTLNGLKYIDGIVSGL